MTEIEISDALRMAAAAKGIEGQPELAAVFQQMIDGLYRTTAKMDGLLAPAFFDLQAEMERLGGVMRQMEQERRRQLWNWLGRVLPWRWAGWLAAHCPKAMLSWWWWNVYMR